jgi:hypothetical protein
MLRKDIVGGYKVLSLELHLRVEGLRLYGSSVMDLLIAPCM